MVSKLFLKHAGFDTCPSSRQHHNASGLEPEDAPSTFSSDDTAACAQAISSPCQGSLAEAVAAKGQETGINAVSPVARLQILVGGLWLSVEACTVRAYLRDGTFARCSQSYTHSVPVCVKRHRKKLLHRHVQIRVEMQTLSPCG